MLRTAKEYDYFHVAYKAREPLFPQLRDATIVRLFYILTFLAPQGILMDGKHFIRKQDLSSYLGVSRREQYRFWNEVSTCNIISEINDCLYVNTDIFFYGRISKKQIKDMRHKDMSLVKVYSSPIREMYMGSSSITVKPLSYLFKIIPYVHSKCGVCCTEPDGIDADCITPMSISDISNVVGYDKSNAYRLLEIFLGYEAKISGENTRIARYIPNKEESDDQWGMFINQNIYHTIAINDF